MCDRPLDPDIDEDAYLDDPDDWDDDRDDWDDDPDDTGTTAIQIGTRRTGKMSVTTITTRKLDP